jgi:hypothetical protein
MPVKPNRKGVPKKKKGPVKTNWLFDFLKDITYDKKNVLAPHNEGQYSKFMITKFLSCKTKYLDLCDILNEHQQRWDNYQFHKFCLEVFPKSKVFFKYGDIKGKFAISEHSEEVKIIGDYFKIAPLQALDYYRLDGDELVKDIQRLYGKIP